MNVSEMYKNELDNVSDRGILSSSSKRILEIQEVKA